MPVLDSEAGDEGRRVLSAYSVTYEAEELKKEEVTNVAGIDRGIWFLEVTYDSQVKRA